MSGSSIVMVAIAATAVLVAWRRGWFKTDESGVPVVEPVAWRHVTADDLSDRWDAIETASDFESNIHVRGRTLGIDDVIGIIAALGFAAIIAADPISTMGGQPAVRIGAALFGASMAVAIYRMATVGLYASTRGLMIIGLRRRVLPWPKVATVAILGVHQGMAH